MLLNKIRILENGFMNKVLAKIKSQPKFYFLFLAAVCLGTYLRLNQIWDQIVLDDEWHAIRYALTGSFPYILTHFNVNDNCIPLTFFYKFLMEMGGLNDLGFRLPILIPGIFILLFIPLKLKNVIGDRPTLFLSFFLAISPFITLYSRFARSYVFTILFGTIAVFSLWEWIKNGRKKQAIIFVLSATLGVYFHLLVLPIVLASIGYFLIITFFGERKPDTINNLPSFRKVLRLSFIVLAASLLVILPALPTLKEITHYAGLSQVFWSTIPGAFELLSGTPEIILQIIFLFTFIAGLNVLFKKDKLLGGYLLSIITAQILFILISQPIFINIPIVFSRYFLPVWPLCLILVSVGIHYFLTISEHLFHSYRMKMVVTGFISFIFFFFLLMTGPLPAIHQNPNSFMHHSAYHESYQPIDWRRSYDSHYENSFFISEEEVPQFYKDIGKDEEKYTLIETPRFGMDHIELYYYYQHFHKKNVKIAEVPNFNLTDNRTSKIFFRNFVNIEDVEAIRHTKARFLIIHKKVPHRDPLPESDREANEGTLEGMAIEAKARINFLQNYFGKPYFEDDLITVFKINET